MAPETTIDLRQLGSRDDVLAVLSQVERSIGLLRRHAGDEAQRAADAERLSREFAMLEDERARLLERQCALESQLAAARGTMSEFERRVRDAEARAGDAERRVQDAVGECARIEGEALSLALARDEDLRRTLDAERHAHASRAEALQRAFESRVDELERALAASAAGEAGAAEAAAGAIARLIAEHRTLADAASRRIAELEAELAAARDAVEAAERALSEAAASRASPDAPLAEAQQAASIAEAVEARAEELAAARVQQLLAPKLAGLAQAAAFLRTRKSRLAALRSGLKSRARELRVERAALESHVPQGFTPDASAGFGAASQGFAGGAAAEASAIRAERSALAVEKQEILDLRAILEASEASLARRAAGTRLTTAVGLALAFAAFAGLASWHLAGALHPTPALAQVELAVTSRAPEAKQAGGEPAAAADADAAGRGATIQSWIDGRVDDESFAGVVAGRLLDRGRTRAEGDALAANFAERLTVESDGASVRLALRGQGLDETAATLDAVATSIVAEANRDPARRGDFLRVGIANAKQEIGRTVFAQAEALPDPERIARAGGFFGGFFVAAALVAGVFALFTRRATSLATQGY